MSKVGKVQAGQGLASKEQKAFRELLAAYEERAYKRGLKTADTILKKSPEHGETVCMKGIILYNMARKEEGRELVKSGDFKRRASIPCCSSMPRKGRGSLQLLAVRRVQGKTDVRNSSPRLAIL